MTRERDERDEVGLDLPAEPVDPETERQLRERAAAQGGDAGAGVDPGIEHMPSGETGVSREDAPGQ